MSNLLKLQQVDVESSTEPAVSLASTCCTSISAASVQCQDEESQ
jgi:hypothetical protein